MSDPTTAELIDALLEGVPIKPRRWSGDTHADDDGEWLIDELAIDLLAADRLAELEADLAEAVDAIRYALAGSPRWQECAHSVIAAWEARRG